MTEKRFILIDGVKKGTHSGIWDNLKQNNQRVGDELWVGEVVAMLNEGIAIVKENEQLKESVYSWSKSYNRVYNENERLKTRVDYLERKIQRERASAMKQHEKWEKEIQKENEKLKSTIKEVTELLSDEVDLFSDKATEHDIIAYVELKELDNKDAYYMATATKEAIRMLKELQE